MIGMLIWVLLLIFIIVKISGGKNKKNPKAVPPKNAKKPQTEAKSSQVSSQRQTRQSSGTKKQKAGTEQQWDARQQKYIQNGQNSEAEQQSDAKRQTSQEELKRRLQEKYRTSQPAANAVSASGQGSRNSQSDLVARASRNVAETEADLLQMQEENDLLETVNDIMAKGVDTSIPFERDFIAEGMEIINRVTL